MELLAKLVERGILPGPSATLSAPIFTEALVLPADNAAVLEPFGITVTAPGSGNFVIVDRTQERQAIRIDFAEARTCVAIVGRTRQMTADLTLRGHAAICCFAGGGGIQGPDRVNVQVDGDRACAYFGRATTFVNAQFLLEGEGRKLICGDDCMFSWGIFARNYDSHCVFDLASGEAINTPTDLTIGSHVWIGQDALIAKGVSIGTGSIIGARSTVVGDIAPSTAVAGTPARAIRGNVGWTRARYADAGAIAAAREKVAAAIGGDPAGS